MSVFDKNLSEDQIMMREVCRRFVNNTIIPFVSSNWQKEWDLTPESRIPDSILEDADKIGVRTLAVPEEYGGVPLDKKSEVRTFAIISEEIARGDSGIADKLVQNWKVSVLLRELASKEHQDKWFKKLMNEPQFLFAHALTEPKGASDRWLGYNAPEAAMDTKAKKVDGGWVINGRKHYISNGYDAGLYVVYANTAPGKGMMDGTSSFIVPRGTQGFNITRCNETVGCRYMNNGELEFIDCFVPNDNLLCEGSALNKAGIYFQPGKIIQSAKNLGVGQAALDKTAEYVQNYKRGGRLLIKHQIVACRLADMATKVAAVRSLVMQAAHAVDVQSSDANALCNMAKVFASQEILKVCQNAMELHGGMGAMLDAGVEKLMRDATIFLHMDATVDISHFKIVKALWPDTAGVYAGPEEKS
jgi:acyl-CoA dehydrogenase